MIAIVAVVAGGIAVIQLIQASNISLKLSLRGMNYLAREQAQYWQGREESYIKQLTGIADIMSEFEMLPAQDRRDQYDNMLKATLITTPTSPAYFPFGNRTPWTVWTASI